MYQEIRTNILWCYRKSKWRMAREIAGCFLAMAAGLLLLVFVATNLWG